MDDNPLPHRAKRVEDILEVGLNWPVNSFDINRIENMWDYIISMHRQWRLVHTWRWGAALPEYFATRVELL